MSSKLWDIVICKTSQPETEPNTGPKEVLIEWLKTLQISTSREVFAYDVIQIVSVALVEYFQQKQLHEMEDVDFGEADTENLRTQLNFERILQPDGMTVAQFVGTVTGALLSYFASSVADEAFTIDFDATLESLMEQGTQLLSKRLSAMTIIEHTCEALSDFPKFTSAAASDLSAGMLVNGGNDNPKETGQILCGILFANLYCILALEAIGQNKPNNKSSTLTDIIRNDANIDLPAASRLLSKEFPPALKELFAVHKLNGKKSFPYQIGTQFSKLFCAVLTNYRISPASSVERTANSLLSSVKFYNKCIQAIAPENEWSSRSFAEYFLFERIFRLNTKSTLCYEEFRTKKLVLSPKLLGDFFFHSPLVIFPKGNLLNLFYEGETDSESYKKSVQFLHFLIQLSSDWFPQALGVLRTYMKKNSIQSFDEVNQFFFPWFRNFSDFQKMYIPYLDIPNRNEKASSPIPRALIENYSKGWCAFAPDSGYCAKSFVPYSLEDWKLKSTADDLEPEDYHVLRDILGTI